MLEIPMIVGPEISARGEAVLACLIGGGVADSLAVEALTTMTWYTAGGALHALAAADVDRRSERGVRLASLPQESFPTVHRVARYLDTDATAEHFGGGLRRLISSYERG
jgi:hypothetical protein